MTGSIAARRVISVKALADRIISASCWNSFLTGQKSMSAQNSNGVHRVGERPTACAMRRPIFAMINAGTQMAQCTDGASIQAKEEKMEVYQLEKAIWDDGDFEDMGWHDVTIWSMLADTESYEYLLDLDYIFKWVHPAEGEKSFRFWVAPVTMVFENVHGVEIDIQSMDGIIEINHLYREDLPPTSNGKAWYSYIFECHQGQISLRATAYKMYVRRKPELLQQQRLSLEERNGIHFDRSTESV